jgi:hypothetical protein
VLNGWLLSKVKSKIGLEMGVSRTFELIFGYSELEMEIIRKYFLIQALEIRRGV